MATSTLRDVAHRHRQVASILSDPKDAAIIRSYADELEGLSRAEVMPVCQGDDPAEVSEASMRAILRKAFPAVPAGVFSKLVAALDEPCKDAC